MRARSGGRRSRSSRPSSKHGSAPSETDYEANRGIDGILYAGIHDCGAPPPMKRGFGTTMAAQKRTRKKAARKPSAPRKKRYDMALIQRGARLRRSPFFDKTWEAGCKAYTVYNHTFLPSYYDDPVNEYWHLLKHVALWDVADATNAPTVAAEPISFMQLLTPRDMTKCQVGQGKYVLITDADGGILNDPVLLRLEENRFWIALADSDILLWAKGVARHAGMKVTIREPDEIGRAHV